MQLWKKSFLFSVLIIQALIFVALFAEITNQFKQTLQNELVLFRQLVDSSQFFVSRIESTEGIESLKKMADISGEKLDYYFEVFDSEEIYFSSIPESLNSSTSEKIGLITFEKNKKEHYFLLKDNVETDSKFVTVRFVKDLSRVYSNQLKKTIINYLIGLLFSGSIALLLYFQMRKLYQPIQNISHELRTPLTLIVGYSELLLRTKVNEEQKMKMSSQIIEETKRLQEIIEQLLLMGELKDGDVQKEALLLSEQLINYQDKYQQMMLSVVDEQPVLVNQTLIFRLFDNLLSNAYRASDSVVINIHQKTVTMTNTGKTIPARTLKKLNKGKKLESHEFEGTGQGLIICQEIMKLHEGKLRINSDENSVVVCLEFT